MFSFDFDEILDFAIPISLSLFLVVKNVQFFNFLLLVLVGGKTYQVGRVYASGTTTSLHLASFNLQHNKAAHKQINHSNESFLAIILVSFWHFQFFLFQICKNDIDRRKNCFRVFFLKNFVFQCFWLNTQILFTIRRGPRPRPVSRLKRGRWSSGAKRRRRDSNRCQWMAAELELEK